MPADLFGGGGPSIPYEPVDAEKLIAECWAISKEKRDTGATFVMYSGTIETVSCLENVVLDQRDEMFRVDIMPRAVFKDWLNKIRVGHLNFYSAVYTEHMGCTPCGTENALYAPWFHSKLLEGMIRNMIEQRDKYFLSKERWSE